jgi:hypothetical protein
MKDQWKRDPRLAAISDITNYLRSIGKVETGHRKMPTFVGCGWTEYLMQSELIEMNDRLPFYWRSRNPYCGVLKNNKDPDQLKRLEDNKKKVERYYNKKGGN